MNMILFALGLTLPVLERSLRKYLCPLTLRASLHCTPALQIIYRITPAKIRKSVATKRINKRNRSLRRSSKNSLKANSPHALNLPASPWSCRSVPPRSRCSTSSFVWVTVFGPCPVSSSFLPSWASLWSSLLPSPSDHKGMRHVVSLVSSAPQMVLPHS